MKSNTKQNQVNAKKMEKRFQLTGIEHNHTRANEHSCLEYREAKSDEQVRDEYRESLNLLQRYSFFDGDAGAFIKEQLDQISFDVTSRVYYDLETLEVNLILSDNPNCEAIITYVLMLEAVGLVQSIYATESRDTVSVRGLSFEVWPSSVIQAASFLRLCKPPEN